MMRSVTCYSRYTLGGSENSRLCKVVAVKERRFSLADFQCDVFLYAFWHAYNHLLH